MKFNGKKIVEKAAIAVVLAVVCSFDQFPKHSLLYNVGEVFIFTVFTFATLLGLDQTIYRSNSSLRKMD